MKYKLADSRWRVFLWNFYAEQKLRINCGPWAIGINATLINMTSLKLRQGRLQHEGCNFKLTTASSALAEY